MILVYAVGGLFFGWVPVLLMAIWLIDGTLEFSGKRRRENRVARKQAIEWQMTLWQREDAARKWHEYEKVHG
jgi:hypothetical protein